MYDDMGKFCVDSYYDFLGFKQGTIIKDSFPNCTAGVAVLDKQIQEADDQMEQINLLVNRTIANEDLNCHGAVRLNIAFLTCCYILVVITVMLVKILWSADREIRARRRNKHYFKFSGADLSGDKLVCLLTFCGVVGFFMTSFANLDAAMNALDHIDPLTLVKQDTNLAEPFNGANVIIQLKIEFYLSSFMPFKSNQLNLQTVLLFIVAMSVTRGYVKQSPSAFRLAAVASLLHAIVQWPAITGNFVSFQKNNLFWWSDDDECAQFHTGSPYFIKGGNTEASARYCADTRTAMAGALISFVAIQFNIFACYNVFMSNKHKQSLEVMSSVDSGIDGLAPQHAGRNRADFFAFGTGEFEALPEVGDLGEVIEGGGPAASKSRPSGASGGEREFSVSSDLRNSSGKGLKSTLNDALLPGRD